MKYYPEAILAAAAALAWWLMRDMALPNDVGWQFWIARQMLGGTELYAQIWEVNPPLWFWSSIPVQWLAERTGVAWGAVLAGVVVSLGAGCAWLVARLLESHSRAGRLGVLLLVFAMTVILPAALMGQREQLALIVSLPYAALIARRHAGYSVPLVLAIGVAVLGAYGFALKHYFVAVPLVLELWLMQRLRGAWRPWRPELLVLAGLAIAYAAAVAILAPAFFTLILPMVNTAYFSSQETLFFTVVKPYVLSWVIVAVFLWVTRHQPLRETASAPVADAAFTALLLVWAAFALGYFLQSRGWNYHSIAATGALGAAAGLRLMRIRPGPGLAIGTGLLAGLVMLSYPYRVQPQPEDPYLDQLAPGDGVFVAGFDASTVWQRGREELVWVSRAYSLWMVKAIAEAEATGQMTPALEQLEAQVLAATSQDIRCNPPQLILMKANSATRGKGGSFGFDEFLLRDPALRRFVAEHYAPARRDAIGTVYLRRTPAARAPDRDCRDIR